ncbi:MAG: histidine kinase dimerization/phosphoacceptor domain-containing protein, partial [Stackebrandtia sp.]
MRVPSSPLVRDSLFAGVLTVVTQVELVAAGDRVAGPVVVQHLVFAVMTGSVALRRRAPLAATLVCAAGMALQTLAGAAPVVGGFLAMLIVVASLGYHAALRAGVIGLSAMAAAATLYDVVAAEFVLADMVGNAAIVVGAWGFARLTRVSTDRRVDAEVPRERFAHDAVLAERTRIARDLHDSVAHAVTLMTLQAGGARERANDPLVVDALRS